MSNEKHYDYYMTDADTCKQMLDRYELEIANDRDQVHAQLLNDTGAIARSEQKSWGRPSYICGLVFTEKALNQMESTAHLKRLNSDILDGERVVVVRGKMNSNAGKAFQKFITDANKSLENLPSLKDWLIKEFNVMRTGEGGPGPSGFGISMLSTYCGTIGNRLGFAIPNSDNQRHGVIEIPECFEKVTYGTWYDLVNKKEGQQ